MNKTHSRHGPLVAVALLVAGLAAVALTAPLQALEPAERAVVSVYSGGVDFRPAVSYSGATLSVSGNGVTFQQAFAGGKHLSIGMLDPEGQPLADGTYTWSLNLLPDAATARALRIAASRNGGLAPEPWEAQTGTFTIRNGLIVDPGLSEDPSGRIEGTLLGSGLSSSMGASSSSALSGSFAEDSDGQVGSRQGVEQQVSSAATRQAETAFVGGFQQLDRAGFERSDTTTLALGKSPEAPLSADTNQPMQTRRAFAAPPKASADGANGRPRSGEDQ